MAKKQIPWGRILAEFFVVLFGVTVALLADDWREFRNDRRQENIALQEVLADLRTDSTELATQLRNQRSDEAAALWALRHLEEDLPGDSVWGMVSDLYLYAAYEQVSSGYKGLRDSGRLSILHDPELKRQIVLYYEVTQPYLWHWYDQWWEAYGELNDGSAPYLRMVPNESGDRLRGNFETRFVRPWREISRDHRQVFRVERIGIIASVFANRIESKLEENGELQRRVREALGIEAAETTSG